MKILKLIRLTPYIIARRLRSILRKMGLRKPARKYYLASLSGGALMIWTPGGNVVLPTALARKLAVDIPQAADLADQFMEKEYD